MQLPLGLNISQMQTRWKSILDILIKNPLNSVSILENVALINGVTVVNHKLSRVQQGWFLTDIQGVATIYRSASFNATNLTLTSSAAVVVNIGVF